MKREIDHIADSDKKVEQTAESAQNVQNEDLIQRKAAIEALARMMSRSYTPDGSHPADEEIFRVQEVFADCIEALEILPSVQPERKKGRWIIDGHHVQCDVCFESMCNTDREGDKIPINFCPNCGAMMLRGEQDG